MEDSTWMFILAFLLLCMGMFAGHIGHLDIAVLSSFFSAISIGLGLWKYEHGE